jgi:pyroglutamyl-peptidase
MNQKKPSKEKRTRQPDRTILVTGFEPFGDESVNPSQEIARQLHGLQVGAHRVVAGLLPCVFGGSRMELRRLIKQHRPTVVICLGLAAGRREVTPERVALNIDDARIADNAGKQPLDRPVVRGGPAAYWSTLPIKAIVEALQARRIPATVSQTAGTFVCNHVFYGLMHDLARPSAGKLMRGGFIHVPALPVTGRKRPSLPLETSVEAVLTAIETTLAVRGDVTAPGGQIS